MKIPTNGYTDFISSFLCLIILHKPESDGFGSLIVWLMLVEFGQICFCIFLQIIPLGQTLIYIYFKYFKIPNSIHPFHFLIIKKS